MLADVRLHLKDMVGSRALAPMVVWAAVSSAITLPFRSFGHDTLREQSPRIRSYGNQSSSHHSQLYSVRRIWQAGIAKCRKFVLELIDKAGHASKLSVHEPHRSSGP